MDSEERPSKIQKLSHDTSKDDSSEKKHNHENPVQHTELQESNGLVAETSPQHDSTGKLSSSDMNRETSSNIDDEENPLDEHDDNDQSQAEAKPLSKNQQKKLRKKQLFEELRKARKVKRKEKVVEKRERKRAAKAAAALDAGSGPPEAKPKGQDNGRKRQIHVQLPITFVLDCGFDELMNENERISLGGQITRSYSDNKNATFNAHLVVSSWGGFLKERFDTLMTRNHESWRGVRWIEGDFVEASERAKEWMVEENGGALEGAFAKYANEMASPEHLKEQGEIVYLSSESDSTLNELKPYSTYIIGGLVDKNRHKGICYKRAMDRGIKTARLPIGDFMVMNSRKVLTTNHVSEMLVKWLEFGDWGEAFLQVMPKRKGGQLKEQEKSEEVQTEDHTNSNTLVDGSSDIRDTARAENQVVADSLQNTSVDTNEGSS